MDETDKRILAELQINNRVSTEILGEKIGLSATSCQRRLKRLRASNVISQEVAVLNGLELENYVTVIVELTIKQGSAEIIDRFKQKMSAHDSVQQCYYVTGQVDFILIIAARNMLAYEQLTRELFFTDNNIQKFQSTVVMEHVKVGLTIPI